MKKVIKVAFSVIFIDQIALGITYPLLTLIFFSAQSNLFPVDTPNSVRAFYYGLCSSLPFLVGIFLVPMLSILSDCRGRRLLLIICTLGTAIFLFGAAIGIIFGSVFLVIVSRALTGVFARVNPIGQAIVGDSEKNTQKTIQMGNLQVVLSISAIIGALLGGYFAQGFWFETLNFSFPYLIATALGLLGMLIAICYLDETNHSLKENRAPYFKTFIDTLKLLKNPRIIKIAFITFLFQFTWGIYFQFSPPVAKVYLGFDAKAIGLFISVIYIWLSIGAFFGVKLFCRFFSEWQAIKYSNYLIMLGFLITFIALYIKGSFLGHLLFWAGLAPMAIGDVIAYSCVCTLFSDAVSAKDQGKVMGVCFIIASFAWGLGGFIAGLLGTIGCEMPLLIAPLGSLVFIFYSFFLKIKRS